MGKLVNIVYSDAPGRSYAVPEEQAADILQNDPSARLETADDAAAAVAEKVKDARYSGAEAAVDAAVIGAARGASFGQTDLIFGGEDLRELQARQGAASLVGEIGGSLLTGKAPVSLVAKGAKAIGLAGKAATVAGEASTLSKIGRAAGEAALEGAFQGAGEGISEVALTGNWEQAASIISSRAAFGGAVGGAAGTAGKSLEVGLQKAKAGIDAIRTKAASAGGDLVGKTPKELDTIADDEVRRLVDEQAATKASTVDDLKTYRQAMREANPHLVAGDEGIAQLAGADATMRKALDAPKNLAGSPTQLAKPLEKQEQALVRALEKREELLANFEKVNRGIADDLTKRLAELPAEAAEIELSGKAAKRYAAFADVKMSRKATTISVPKEQAVEFLTAIENGSVKGAGETALGKLEGLPEQNRALQAKIESTRVPKSELSSERLTAIRQAKEEIQAAASKPRGFVEDVAQATIFGYAADQLTGVPLLGPLIGAKVARGATDLVFGRMGKATAEMAARTSKGIDAFLNVSQKAMPHVPVVATKVLSRVAYGPAGDRDDGKKKSLPSLFNARSKEIREQTAFGPDGRAYMRPEARQAMSAQLAGVRAADPIAADRMETTLARRLEFLANKLPRRPDIGGVPLGPDRWQPSDMDMRLFARYAAAVEDPAAIVERLANGTITPEDSEAMRTVYPETFAEIQARIIEKLPELTKTLPYNRRVALSIFSGVPVDPAMRPEILGVLQSQFEDEPGTEGGTQQPAPAPQFGSIQKSTPEPTPAQSRAG